MIPGKRASKKYGSKTASKFGIEIVPHLKVHRKQQEKGLSKVDGNDVRGIICVIQNQCKNAITEESIEIASECLLVISKIKLHCPYLVYSGWITRLVQCVVLAFGSEFDASENTLLLVDVVLDTLHVLLKKTKALFTSQLVSMFIELAAAWTPQEKATLVLLLLRTMSTIDLAKTYIRSNFLLRSSCVCLEEILNRLLDFIHIYVSTYDAANLKCVRSTLLAAILYFGHHGLLDYFNSLCW